MIQAKCIQKFRDKNGNIYGYRLIDLNGQTQDVEAKQLKIAIDKKLINIVNLTLTKDGRLIDTASDNLQSEKLGKAPVQRQEVKKNNSVVISDLAKAFTLLERSYIGMGDCFTEVVESICMDAGIDVDIWDEDRDVQVKYLNKAHQILIDKNPGYLTSRLRELLLDESEYYLNQIKEYMYSEGVSKVNDSKMYKAVYLIYKSFKDTDKKLAKILKEELLDDMKQNGVASIKVGYAVGHEYFRYLDGNLFGTVTNDYFTVGHAITTDEKKEFKELKPYSYMCRKDFNGLSPRPEVGIAFLFKNSDKSDKVDVDIKMFRRGYIGKSVCSVVGYILDLGSFTLNINDKNNAKIVANYCNDYAAWIRKFCSKHQSLLHILPLGAPIEKFN